MVAVFFGTNMGDNEKNNSSESPIDPVLVQQFFALLKQQNDIDFKRIYDALDQRDKGLTGQIDEIKDLINTKNREFGDRLSTVENKINIKLDAVDEALRGNGRIGLFEQIRNINTKIKVIFTCVIVLFGFKLWGLGMDEWVRSFFRREAHASSSLVQPQQPMSQPTSQPTSRPVVRATTTTRGK